MILQQHTTLGRSQPQNQFFFGGGTNFEGGICIAYRTRSSATAEKQRVSCPHGGRVGLDRTSSPSPPPPLATPMRMVESESHNVHTSSVPSVKRTVR